MSFYVNRKCTGPSDTCVVTVSTRFETNIDVLHVLYHYLGEGEAFARPQDAAHAAIDVIAAWQRDCPGTPLHLSFEPTENHIPELMPYARDAVDAEARMLLHARACWMSGERCDECDCGLSDKAVKKTIEGDEYAFCSLDCVDTFQDGYYADLDADEDDEDEEADEDE